MCWVLKSVLSDNGTRFTQTGYNSNKRSTRKFIGGYQQGKRCFARLGSFASTCSFVSNPGSWFLWKCPRGRSGASQQTNADANQYISDTARDHRNGSVFILHSIHDHRAYQAVLGSWRTALQGEHICFTFLVFVVDIQLTVISIHKYFSFVKPLRIIITHDRTLLIIIVVWLSAFACSIGPILGWTEIAYKSSASMCGPRYPHNAAEISHTVFLLCVVYTFPILAMIFLYWRIIRAVKRHCQRIRDTAIIDDRGILAQKKIIITLVFVVAVFVACWTPFFIYGVLTLVMDVSRFSRHFLRSAYICGFLYSVCNPIILGARNPRFRRGFKELVTFRRIRRSSLQSPVGAGAVADAVSGSSQSESPLRRPSSDYLAEKRCSVWFLSSQNSLLSLEPEPRRRKLRWIETNL